MALGAFRILFWLDAAPPVIADPCPQIHVAVTRMPAALCAVTPMPAVTVALTAMPRALSPVTVMPAITMSVDC